jgi:hypothetical protein
MPGFLNAGGSFGVGAGGSSSTGQGGASSSNTGDGNDGGSVGEIQSGGDAFGFGQLGQINSFRKKRELPEPSSSSSAIEEKRNEP